MKESGWIALIVGGAAVAATTAVCIAAACLGGKSTSPNTNNNDAPPDLNTSISQTNEEPNKPISDNPNKGTPSNEKDPSNNKNPSTNKTNPPKGNNGNPGPKKIDEPNKTDFKFKVNSNLNNASNISFEKDGFTCFFNWALNNLPLSIISQLFHFKNENQATVFLTLYRDRYNEYTKFNKDSDKISLKSLNEALKEQSPDKKNFVPLTADDVRNALKNTTNILLEKAPQPSEYGHLEPIVYLDQRANRELSSSDTTGPVWFCQNLNSSFISAHNLLYKYCKNEKYNAEKIKKIEFNSKFISEYFDLKNKAIPFNKNEILDISKKTTVETGKILILIKFMFEVLKLDNNEIKDLETNKKISTIMHKAKDFLEQDAKKFQLESQQVSNSLGLSSFVVSDSNELSYFSQMASQLHLELVKPLKTKIKFDESIKQGLSPEQKLEIGGYDQASSAQREKNKQGVKFKPDLESDEEMRLRNQIEGSSKYTTNQGNSGTCWMIATVSLLTRCGIMIPINELHALATAGKFPYTGATSGSHEQVNLVVRVVIALMNRVNEMIAMTVQFNNVHDTPNNINKIIEFLKRTLATETAIASNDWFGNHHMVTIVDYVVINGVEYFIVESWERQFRVTCTEFVKGVIQNSYFTLAERTLTNNGTFQSINTDNIVERLRNAENIYEFTVIIDYYIKSVGSPVILPPDVIDKINSLIIGNPEFYSIKSKKNAEKIVNQSSSTSTNNTPTTNKQNKNIPKKKKTSSDDNKDKQSTSPRVKFTFIQKINGGPPPQINRITCEVTG